MMNLVSEAKKFELELEGVRAQGGNEGILKPGSDLERSALR